MAIYTVRVLSVCTGGEHVTLSIRRDGAEIKKAVITRDEIWQNATTWDEAMIFFIRQAIKKAGATTMAQAKVAVEAAEWVV